MKSFIEVQFPIGPLSLESYIERLPYVGKPLNTLGKWWGVKPLVLVRAIILGSVFPASNDPERWPDDLDIFLKCMCLDNAGMWKRKTKPLPASLCYTYASRDEREELFEDNWWRRGAPKALKQALEKRVFYALDHTEQREYCCRVEEIDGPPEESWEEINAYLGTSASTLPELVQKLARRRFGSSLKVGDAFCGIGSIAFEAAELGCDVYASELNPVACLLTWGALNIIGGTNEFRESVHEEQERIYDEVDSWILENGLEISEEGWRAEAYLYCVEIKVPEWDGWHIPISPSWIVAPKIKAWVDLVPIESEKRFGFRLVKGGDGYDMADQGTKQGGDIVCPASLWKIFKMDGRHKNIPRSLPYSQLIENAGGLRRWEKRDFIPRPDDLIQERLYCIRWRKHDWIDDRGRKRKGDIVFREPRSHDLDVENKVVGMLRGLFDDWQVAGWIPSWRIEEGYNTNQPIREKGWTHWHHLFTPRQLVMAGYYSQQMAQRDPKVRAALLVNLGRLLDYNSRLCRWLGSDSGGMGGTKQVFYNQAFNTFLNYGGRAWPATKVQTLTKHLSTETHGVNKTSVLADAREIDANCTIWVTDPPYADAVNYEELSEFFLAWYVPHLKAVFPDWYTHSMRARAVKGSDAPFRIAMAECYRHLTDHMPDDGMQVLMFTHKSTDVWEDLALIMWAAGLQVKQVWSIATETPGAGMRQGSYVQATYNMVLKKRADNKMGFIDFITPRVNKRVKEVITRMRENQIEGGLTRCGYTDTDYLLAAQAVAAEVVTEYSRIDGIDLEVELRTPNAERGRSALRSLMENAKRTATDFLVPPALDQALKNLAVPADPYQFWRDFSPEEKFLLKGLELEQQGVFKIGAFQDLGRAYGLSNYEDLLGPTRANDTRTKLPEEFPRPDGLRFEEVSASDRNLWRHSPTRHTYHSLRLLNSGADIDRAIKHLVDSTDFLDMRTSRLAIIITYLRETTLYLSHWEPYRDQLTALTIGVENWRG